MSPNLIPQYRSSENGANVVINNNLVPNNPSITPLTMVYPYNFVAFPPNYMNYNPYLSNIYYPTVISPQLISNPIQNT